MIRGRSRSSAYPQATGEQAVSNLVLSVSPPNIGGMETRILTRAEAHFRGYTDDEIQRAIKEGSLHRLTRGLYYTGELAEDQQHLARALVAIEKLPPGSTASHVSAAVLHGLPVGGMSLGIVHLTRAGATGRVAQSVHVHSATLDRECVQDLCGVAVTTPARTIVDVARMSHDDGVVLGDAALRSRTTTFSELKAALDDGRYRRGIGRARRAVAAMSERSESPGESRSRLMFARRGVPRPLLQANVFAVDGEWIARTDFLWERFGVVGEFDGLEKYRAAGADTVVTEKKREDRLRAAGWMVVRWTFEDLANPAGLVRRLESRFEIGRRRPSHFSIDPLPTVSSPALSPLLLAYGVGEDWRSRAVS